MMERESHSDQVRRSRAGDEFHYRWTARRCLELINPKTSLDHVRIESSDNPDVEGECVIDVSEYFKFDNTEQYNVSYYQLKHSSLSELKNLTYSELRHTFQGFVKRYNNDILSEKIKNASFYIITNRPISLDLKEELEQVKRTKKNGQGRYILKIKKDTDIEDDVLISFCENLYLIDGESDYVKQKSILKYELSHFFGSSVDDEVNQLITLVRENALPDREGYIKKEDILRILGLSSVDALFPAPSDFESLKKYVKCTQNQEIAEYILSQDGPFIVTADGGVGKSIFTHHFIDNVPAHSVGVGYDCFGGGSYRNPAKLRHKANKALVQIVNELAEKGLCKYLLPAERYDEEYYYQIFLQRISNAIKEIRKIHDNGKLFILIDAADNAEIIAAERNEKCFAKNLLHMGLPQGCVLVMLCRPYRKNLIDPRNEIKELELAPFSLNETKLHLMNFYVNFSIYDVEELHRLTGGNPRVQSTVFYKYPDSLEGMLGSLGPDFTSVSDLLEAQLDNSIRKLYREHGNQNQEQIDAICSGLSVFPPSVPIDVLARIADVSKSLIKSFVTDIGGVLFLARDNIQFKDEPTETWFRERYSASSELLRLFIEKLRPIANSNGYVARVIPRLLFRAGFYKELFSMAISEDYLSEGDNIDEKNIRTDRLNFSFRTAVKMKCWKEAIQIAVRAGEESSSNKKLDELICNNIDIVNIIKDEQTLQEWAFLRKFSSAWSGSEYLYSALIFSTMDGFEGFARNSLRSASNWINIALDYQRKEREDKGTVIRLFDEVDLVKLIFLHYNLNGSEGVSFFIHTWSPPLLMIRVVDRFISALIDHGKFNDIYDIAKFLHKKSYCILGINAALVRNYHFLPKEIFENSLRVLISKRKYIPKLKKIGEYYPDYSLAESLISFAESCAYHKLSNKNIIKFLDYYFPKYFENYWGGITHEKDRELASRLVALKNILEGKFSINYERYIKKNDLKISSSSWSEMKAVFNRLLPYYFRRACLLLKISLNDKTNLDVCLNFMDSYSNSFIKREILQVYSHELVLRSDMNEVELSQFLDELFIKNSKDFFLIDRVDLLKLVFRSSLPMEFRKKVELDCYKYLLECEKENTMESYSDILIKFARAVLPISIDRAGAYFREALTRLSKFDDETRSRWNAVQSIAKNLSRNNGSNAQMVYRYMRCAEALIQNSNCSSNLDIDDVVRVCVGLHFPSACATISRWRDGNMCLFSTLIYPLVDEAVLKNHISPRVGFSLTGFKGCNASPNFLRTCLNKEIDPEIQQFMLDDTIRDISIDDPTDLMQWDALITISKDFKLNFSDAYYMKEAYYQACERVNKTYKRNKYSSKIDWSHIFNDCDTSTVEGINVAKRNVKNIKVYQDKDFWRHVIFHVPYGYEREFLKNILKIDGLSIYDIKNIIIIIKEKWIDDVLVKQEWPNFFESIGSLFSSDFILRGLDELLKWNIFLKKSEFDNIIHGIYLSLDDIDFFDADLYYGFVAFAIDLVKDEDVQDLFDYALSRIEKQIDDSFGEGTWNETLIPLNSDFDSLMGVIWTALGSPDSSLRWQAAHCVLRLARYNCKDAFKFLSDCLENGVLLPFGGKKYFFYLLHAKLYLLIAYARVSKENPNLLFSYSKLFEMYAVSNFPHALIQYMSSLIALNIENKIPNTYFSNILYRFKVNAGVEPNARLIEDSISSVAKSVTGKRSALIYGDFLWYWFRDLQIIFDVNSEILDLHSLATDLAEKNLNFEDEYKRASDLRWSRYHDLTHHSHGIYPYIDRYDFYYSYHSYMCVASVLYSNISINKTEWMNFLKRHSLGHNIDFWLSERRDPIPPCVARPNNKIQKENILIEGDIYCLKILIDRFPEKSGDFISIGGYWNSNYENGFYETIRISSVLVLPKSTDKLVNIMSKSTCLSEYVLPFYQEEERQNNPLSKGEIVGWLQLSNTDERTDDFDSYSGKITYPPMQIHSSFLNKLRLIPDEKRRYWHFVNRKKKLIISQLWSQDDKYNRDIKSYNPGTRLIARLSVLQKFCRELKMDIVVSILVERRKRYTYGSKDNELYYKECIFVIKEDGRLYDKNREIIM